ncbi:hypothetical protein Rsub_11795 [Raphidocelis subcapitata]|uniref:Uncharacterized protein n=1 Tax=Raphidocelis subcapitata TaxID=307507 RepID=A0A2V0PGN8_9CHLO|nr:hypothetical protein Rsub_11795 [Raphidocelis subcapitata]|eukprot:GBF98991.1 hypothetical protein Rsub_11795 [Raphidocelis subcapitata]
MPSQQPRADASCPKRGVPTGSGSRRSSSRSSSSNPSSSRSSSRRSRGWWGQLPCSCIVVALLLILLSAPPAGAARQLRQVINTRTSRGVRKPPLAVAIALKAQAVAHISGSGLQHNEATVKSIANDNFPRAGARVATHTSFHAGGEVEAGIAAFGPVSLSQTDTGALAASAADSMPLAMPEGTPGAARGNTLEVFVPQDAHGSGGGGSGLVMTASLGVTGRPSNAFAMSEMGDGPHAIAQAGEATASAFSSRDVDGSAQAQMLPFAPIARSPSPAPGVDDSAGDDEDGGSDDVDDLDDFDDGLDTLGD